MILVRVLFLFLSTTLSTSLLASKEADPQRILFLGNSVFYSRGGLMVPFKGFCQEAGLECKVVSQWATPANAMGIEFLDYGRIPLSLPEVASDRRIHDLIREGDFDFVILDGRRAGYLLPETVELPEKEGSSVPYNKNLEALASLHRTIVTSGAKTVLYMHPGNHTYADIQFPVAQLYQRFTADLEALEVDGKRHPVLLIPAIYLWQDGIRKFGVEAWYEDPNHGTSLARYASACLLYTYLTGLDPRKNAFQQILELDSNWDKLPGTSQQELSEQDSQWIKQQAWLYYSTQP